MANPSTDSLLRYWRIVKVIYRRSFRRIKHYFRKYWHSNSGDWSWLNDSPRPVAALNRHLWRLSVPSFSFYLLLGLSGIIATLGLLANSVAIIIGAMIIAPLMGPIIGIAYSITMGNRRLLRRSSLTLIKGVILLVLLSSLLCRFSGLRLETSEILARSDPNLIDLGVALAAGMAGAFATSRRHITDALPGVAISVALVPPLGVVGIGLAWGNQSLLMGSSLLFITNLVSIIFSGGLIFLLQRYGNLEKAQQGLLLTIVILSLLGIPLGLQMKRLLIKEQVRQNIKDLVTSQILGFSQGDIYSLQIKPKANILMIQLEIASSTNQVTPQQVNELRDMLSQELNQPVNLEVTLIPVKVIKSDPYF